MRSSTLILIACASLVDTAHADGASLALRAAVISEENFEQPAGATAQGKEYQLSLSQRLPDVGAAVIALGLDYQYTRYEYEGLDERNNDLHRLQLPVRMGYTAGPWQLAAVLAPGVSTSSNIMKDLLQEATGDDLLITARFEAGHMAADRVGWLAGLAWDRAFGEARLSPVIGVLWAPDENVHVRLGFPESEIRWQVSGRWQGFLQLAPAGHEWHVVSDDLQTDFDYTVEAWRAELVWSRRLWRLLSFDIGAAYETGRHYEFLDARGAAVDSDIDDAWIFGIGLRLGETTAPRTHTVMP
jgi:hypothetical protein